MFKRATIFHFFGFPVKADATWFFLAVLLSWTASNTVYPQLIPGLSDNVYQWMGVFTVIGILYSIIAHEVAHAVIAEYYKMPIESITLFIFGGVAEMRGEPSHPKGEFFMAIAGPIMSGLLALFFMALAELYRLYFQAGAVSIVFESLGRLNFFIAIFNLVPAFPLDGGRAFRALLWQRKNNLVQATRIASEWGAAFAYLLLAVACYMIVKNNDLLSGIWWAILGFFVHASGAHAVRSMESRSLLNLETVGRFLTKDIVTVSPDLTIADLVDQFINKHYQRHFPVLDRGQLVGVISLKGVLALDRHKWQWLHVASVMEPLSSETVVAIDVSAADALENLQRHGREQLLVTDGRKFVGVITFRDLVNYLSITMKIDHNAPVEKSRTADYEG